MDDERASGQSDQENSQLQEYLQSANKLVPQMEQSFPWYFVMQDTHFMKVHDYENIEGLGSYCNSVSQNEAPGVEAWHQALLWESGAGVDRRGR